MLTVITPDVHVVVTFPPPLEVATERSYDADVSENEPPVELERATVSVDEAVLKVSATEPAVMVRVVAGDAKETV